MADKAVIKNIETLSQSIDLLESRNAFQDDMIEHLHQELTVHQGQIAELKNQLLLMANRIKDNASEPSAKQEIEPPPPHY
jgi:SlyX protein